MKTIAVVFVIVYLQNDRHNTSIINMDAVA
jgi:hypothetical protein